MKSAPVIKQIPIDQIRPGSQQARRYFQPEALAELARSIQESGMVQPVVLRTRVWGYELLAGERRWRAAQLASLHVIPAVIRDDLSGTEAFVIGLIENLQRESLTPMETAAGLKRLAEMFALTHEEIGERIGKSREYVSNHMRLLNLAPDVQAMVNEGLIPLSHAKILAGLELKDQRALAVAVASSEGKLTVRMLEKQVAKLRDDRMVFKPGAFRPGKPGDWQALERGLADHLGYPVTVIAGKSGKGELRVKFHSLDELDGILSRMAYRAK
ncbi:MAG: ParB/RepB/Spo0J family partition protein [Hydrocarboniphaga effusa]|nr:ParB/RepB/Spo0J family partition protein [Hydrocarboniphaga effusa]